MSFARVISEMLNESYQGRSGVSRMQGGMIAKVVDNVDNVAVREERVTMVNGAGVRNFSVVVGSFSVIANAEGLQQRLKNAGYSAQIVKNTDRNMYRVVASTFDDKASAVQSRDQLRSSYPDAWLLYNLK